MPVCEHCNDTHRMDLGERLGVVPCTHCPRPCPKCAHGAYCTTTPCACSCHTSAEQRLRKAGWRRAEGVTALTDRPLPHQVALDVAAAEPRAGIYWPAMVLEPRFEKALLQFWDRIGMTPSGEPPERAIFWVAARGEHFKITIEPATHPARSEPTQATK